MRILIVLTYYRPHTSGSDDLYREVAQAFTNRGHQVTVFTTQYENHLPLEEIVDGVKIIRAPVLLRISKGVIAPTFGLIATRLVRENDVIHLHLPQFDAAGCCFARSDFWQTIHDHLSLRPENPTRSIQFYRQPGGKCDESPGCQVHKPGDHLHPGLRRTFAIFQTILA